MGNFSITEKGDFDHDQNNIMDVLGVDKHRMDEVIGNAQSHMREHNPNGKKSEFLEAILDNCTSITEIVASTLTWNVIATQLDLNDRMKEHKSQEFANSLKIKK